MATTPIQGQTVTLNLSQILPDFPFNVRSKIGKKGEEAYQGIPELAEEIKRQGQLTPVIVRTPNKQGMYPLVAGFRRYEAFTILAGKDKDYPIQATIMALDDLGAAIVNAKENTIRDGISSYDFARRCVDLRDRYKLTQARIAQEFAAGTKMDGQGLSRSYIGNLMACITNLRPEIKEGWKNGGVSAPPLTTLIGWASQTPDEQEHLWNVFRGIKTGDESCLPSPSAPSAPSLPPVRKATEGVLIAALRAVKNDAKLSETVRDAMIGSLQFALGKNKNLRLGEGKASRIVYDPRLEKERIAKEKEAAKEKALKEAEKAQEKANKKAAEAKEAADKAAREAKK